MSVAHEIGRAGGELTELFSGSGRDVVNAVTDRNRSLLGELFIQPVKIGTGILGISLKTVARIAGVLGLGAAKTVGKAAAALPIVPLPGKR